MESLHTLTSMAARQDPRSIHAAHELHSRLTALRSTLSPAAATLLDKMIAHGAKGSGGRAEYLHVKMNQAFISS
jgi:hypothetical protein